MRGRHVKSVGDFKIFEELDEKGISIGYVVVSPDGTVSELLDTIDRAIEHAKKLRRNYDSGLTF